MKKTFRILFAIVIALCTLAACRRSELAETPKITHTVKFSTELPSKTSYIVEGKTVKYDWEESDLDRIKVYEDGEPSIMQEGVIVDSQILIEAIFEGPKGLSHKYTADLNGGVVKSEQVELEDKYDSNCDVLIAKPVTTEELEDEDIYTFSFGRPVAITKLELKNLKAGEKVSKVTILSDQPLVGTYKQDSKDDSAGEWSETSNKIVVTFGMDGDNPITKTVGEEGILPISIVSMPLNSASLKVLIETENGLKYRKVTAATLTLKENNVKSQGIGMTQVTEAKHDEDGWYLVKSVDELFDGDQIRLASNTEGKLGVDASIPIKTGTTRQDYLGSTTAEFSDDKEMMTRVSEPMNLILHEGMDKWSISFIEDDTEHMLGVSGTSFKIDDGTYEFSLSIDDENEYKASLQYLDTKVYFNWNSGSPRFKPYISNETVSMYRPVIYKKYGNPIDKDVLKERTASFNPNKATVTIGADDNVFPELSFDPEEAKGGEQIWTSSDTDVATVVASTGEVTLVSAGTITISVKIAETETYQPCEASYTLTVKPAEEKGVDYLDRDWTGVPDQTGKSVSYSNWSDKKGPASGNTYAGNSAGSNNAIQLRSEKPSGIVVTASKDNKVARKVTVEWNSETLNERTLDIYGKSTAYESASDLYDTDKQGTKLGSIEKGKSTSLDITGDYEYIGLRSNTGAMYLTSIMIKWEDGKEPFDAHFKYTVDGDDVTEVNATVGKDLTVPDLYIGNDKVVPSSGDPAFASSNPEVASITDMGLVTIHKKGDATITATIAADATNKETKVSYTIHVANVLTGIALAEDSAQAKSFYEGDSFRYTGIKLTATYNDEATATLTDEDLTAKNFSGFDSSEAVAEQQITVSYTENGITKTCQYNVEIKPLVTTLHDITVPGTDLNGNSVTVKGGTTKAAAEEKVTLVVTPATGYYLTSLKVNDGEELCTDAIKKGGEVEVTMPAANVNVTASFSNLYTVTLTQPAANGTVKVAETTEGSRQIAYGTSVTVLAEPADGYELDAWNVTGVTLADATKVSTSFTMPDGDVTVTASFKQASSEVVTTMSADNNADIKFVSGSSSAANAFWANSTPLTANNITLSGSNGSSSSYSFFDGNVVRFYQNNSFTITPNGVTIIKVEIVRQTTTGSNTGTINCNGLTASSGNTTTNINVYTGSSTSAVTFTAEAQARFTQIKVTTTKGGSPTPTPTLSSIAVKTAPTKTAYTAGEYFAPAGLVITKTMSDGSTADVTYSDATKGDFTFTPSLTIALATTDKNVTIAYAGKSCEQPITVTSGGGGTTPSTSPCYTLDATNSDNKTSNNGYANEGTVNVDGIEWSVNGNGTINPWRIGGKSLSNTDRTVYSKTSYSSNLSKITLEIGSANSITINSIKLIYSTSKDFNNATTLTASSKSENSTISFTPEGGFPANGYYKFVFNVSVSSTTNKFVEFKKVQFYGYN